jgi:hypothetical protein
MGKNRIFPAVLILFGLILPASGQEETGPKPAELEILKAYIGVWDASIEVWPEGPEAPSIKFQGVETNRPYGEYWIASDFDSEVQGQTMKVHSIVGYDLDQERMVGTVIDHGPYAATMTGEYDEASRTVHWRTEAKTPDGKPMVQQTQVTQKSAGERVLVLRVPGAEDGDFTKFMQIRFVKRE